MRKSDNQNYLYTVSTSPLHYNLIDFSDCTKMWPTIYVNLMAMNEVVVNSKKY